MRCSRYVQHDRLRIKSFQKEVFCIFVEILSCFDELMMVIYVGPYSNLPKKSF